MTNTRGSLPLSQVLERTYSADDDIMSALRFYCPLRRSLNLGRYRAQIQAQIADTTGDVPRKVENLLALYCVQDRSRRDSDAIELFRLLSHPLAPIHPAQG